MTVTKICGITRLVDAQAAIGSGVDLLGFIFYPKSPRYVSSEDAGGIVEAIRTNSRTPGPRFVGVFVDERPRTVERIIERAHLDLVQLHGSEPPELVRDLSPYAYKAIRPHTLAEAQAAFHTYAKTFADTAISTPQLLVDAYHPSLKGGTGRQADLQIAGWLARRCRLLLAGGLTPETVAGAIQSVRPWGVDTASGVEAAKGIKDPRRVVAFLDAVRSADQDHP
jgi:phosphoribosylanthranilate isomerase